MDSIEDFQMKPLTKGLGFHKKPAVLKDSVEKSALAKDALVKPVPPPPHSALFDQKVKVENPKSYEDLVRTAKGSEKTIDSANRTEKLDKQKKALEKLSFQTDLEFKDAFPRPGEKPASSVSAGVFGDLPPQTSTFSGIPMGMPIDFEPPTKRGASDNPPVQKLEPAAFCWPSVIIDGLVVVSLSLIFLISLVLVTNVNLNAIVGAARANFSTRLSLGFLYLAVYQMYIVVARSFFGRSLGEWTFDHQLGKDEQLDSAFYPVKVVARSMIVVLTGIVLLPILSTVLRKDLVGRFVGLELFQQKI